MRRNNGKNWKKIAEALSEHTDTQCLHRWQKVLNPELIKGPWTPEEDAQVRALVKKYGAKKMERDRVQSERKNREAMPGAMA